LRTGPALRCDADLAALSERRDPGPVCGAALDDLPFRDASFDFIAANMVFEHLVQPESTVRELARVTKPGGRILGSYRQRPPLRRLARLPGLRQMLRPNLLMEFERIR
jgi:SAM-dependent methyltransferase